MNKVYFVNDTSDAPNWGCRATTNALKKMVVKSGYEISHTLYLSSMQTEVQYIPNKKLRLVESYSNSIAQSIPRGRSAIQYLNHRFIQSSWNTISGKKDIVPTCFAEFEPFAQQVFAGEIFRTESLCLKECDLVVINGEGSIYDQQRKGRMMLFIAYLAKKYFNKPCILVNHTADVHDPIMFEMASYVYPLLDDVIFREPLSSEACSDFLKKENSLLAADAAFTYRPISDSSWLSVVGREGYFSIWPDSAVGFDPKKPYICVGGSSIYLRPDRPSYDSVPGFIKLCKRLQEQIAPVVLTAPCQTDEKIFRPIAKELNLPLIALSTPTQQAVDILGNASVYISGRWHPSILALTGGTPIVTLTANTYKTQALIEQIELNAPTFNALKLHEEIEGIVKLTHFYIKEGNGLRERIRQRSAKLSELAWENVRYLKNLQKTTEINSKSKNLSHQLIM